ncbi:hypothetical protein [Lentzea sp. NEAU-D7]|uniref:hypothetical protein n=1 Tax=Lentzea sp. NEAU-D7 TaxID=2994667 RepID=UPI00224B4E41|nr:hypothetical protein [Lentzea sp. NEAU-D7]MCX2951407.1 hypothetical protein [Lentzea sp. NEAU-D7]
MRTVIAAGVVLLVTGCGVSTQDEPEPLGTPTISGEAPTPVVTQRRHSTPASSASTPATSTAATPTPTGDR